MADEATAEYSKPASQVDLEERQEAGFASNAVLSTSDEYARRQAEKGDEEDENARSFAVEGNDLEGYIDVSPEYMTYANPSEKPHKAEEGPEQVLEEFAYEEAEKRNDESVTNIPEHGPNDEPPPEESAPEPAQLSATSASTSTSKTTKKTSSSS